MKIHGDPGHCCYDEHGQLTCIVAQMAFPNGRSIGPDWRTLAQEGAHE